LIAVLVTHDIEEAVRIGDKVVVLSQRPARVKAEIEIPIPREARIKGGAMVMQELASYVEQVEKVFNSEADRTNSIQSTEGGV
jgi:ABC-type nitrate/sulfonate/bicarbonate transport system ATPase subunit